MLVFLLLFVALISTQVSSLAPVFDQVIARRIESRDQAVVKDATAMIGLYQAVNKSLPQTITQLSDFAVEVGQPIQSRDLQLYFVPEVIGSLYRYERVIVYAQKRRFITTEADFISRNTCGTGANDDAGFCAPDDAIYTVFDSYDFILEQLKTLNFRMNETFYKVTQTYDGRNAGFPNRTKAGTLISPDSSVTLAAMVGYVGAAASCRGTFPFNGLHLNCSDLFTDFGSPVVYYYKNPREVFLVSQTPFKTNTGASINLSRYARV